MHSPFASARRLQACFAVCAILSAGIIGWASGQEENIPHGTVTKFAWNTSQIFPGTQRDYWIYVPAQYDGQHPACVMVFQDGAGYVDPKGAWHVPLVFDTLIARKEMPVTIGIFISPGVVPASSPDVLPRFNRSFEYDGLGDRYARFLLEEILPEVGKHYRLAEDANSRAIGGSSSGAIAAFTVAWERPDAFSRVLSTIGTYVNQRGGHDYPFLVRKMEPKPLRVFLQDGSNDNNKYGGNWWLANQTMLSALEFAGYEVNHVWGEGGHDSKHGSVILPDALRWLWHDYPAPIAVGTESKQPVMEVLLPNEPWHAVGAAGDRYKMSGGPATNANGDVFFADAASGRIFRVNGDGGGTDGGAAPPQVFVEHAGQVGRLAFGPDGRLYAAEPSQKRIVSYEATAGSAAAGKPTVVARDIAAHDLAITSTGRIYATDSDTRQVWLIDGAHGSRVVDRGLTSPSGVQLTPDQSLLYVSDAHERMVYAFQIQADGSLAYKQPFCYLHLPADAMISGADSMAVDALGNLYVATTMGVQFCDQAGRVNGIIAAPARSSASASIAFGGHTLDTLYASSGDRLFRRRTKATGVLSFQKPIKPPAPRL
jgi:gluconolactonase